MWWVVIRNVPFTPHFSPYFSPFPFFFLHPFFFFLHFHHRCFLSSDGRGSVSEEKTTFLPTNPHPPISLLSFTETQKSIYFPLRAYAPSAHTLGRDWGTVYRLQIKAKWTGEARLLQPFYGRYGAFYLSHKNTHIIRKHTCSQSQCNGHILFELMREGAKTCMGKWLFYDGKIP